ncbi:MAG: hypothetical protein RBU30_06225 [Polyangia bacterium]|jgi:hypothetical protein|nr:hypothetical protein [Polyangia bacterium]
MRQLLLLKKILPFLGMLLFFGMSAACGDDDGGPDPQEVCPSLCQKQDECALLGQVTYEQCVTECLGFAGNMLDDYLFALVTCTETKDCSELTVGVTAQGVCYTENVELCTTNTDDYVEAACTKELECDGITDPTTQQMDECISRMHADGNILICFEQHKVDELEACVEGATSCNPNPLKDCALSVVGLELGLGGQNPTN